MASSSQEADHAPGPVSPPLRPLPAPPLPIGDVDRVSTCLVHRSKVRVRCLARRTANRTPSRRLPGNLRDDLLGLGGQDAPWLRALVARDDPPTLEHV